MFKPENVMSVIKTVTVGRAAKINLGNFENTDVTISFTAQIDEGVDVDAVIQELMDEATAYIRKEGERIEKSMDTKKGYRRY